MALGIESKVSGTFASLWSEILITHLDEDRLFPSVGHLNVGSWAVSRIGCPHDKLQICKVFLIGFPSATADEWTAQMMQVIQ